MRPGLELRPTTEVSTRVDPRVVLSARLLELNATEVEGTVEVELNENPALERIHTPEERLTDLEIVRRLSTHELKPRGDDRELWRSLPSDDSTPDPLDFAASHSTLDQHLRAQLASALPREMMRVAEFVIGSLDPNGYLTEPTEELALASGFPAQAITEAIRALHGCEPAGVGASGVQECLLLQLRSDASVEGRLARLIVRRHLDEFRARRTARICRRYRVLPEVARRAFARILACTPFPAEGFTRGQTVPRSVAVPPDLILSRTEYGWRIEAQGPDPAAFSVSSAYREGLRRPKIAADEKRHLQHYVQRASEFISSLEQRRMTMVRIGRYLIEHQGDFVVTGDYEFLEPLTRSKLAADIGLHESTVSRATRGKYVQIGTGETIAFEVFFKPALRVQKMIEDILSREDGAHPLSDEKIAEMLAHKGVVIARRTVNKYRDRTHLLSSRSRRSA